MSESKEREAFEEGSNSSSSLLLPDPQDYGFEEDIHPKKKSRTWLRPLYIHILIMVFYTIVFFFMAKTLRGQNCHPDMIFSPARSALKYELVHAENDLMKKSPYAGYPTPEGDAAWRELLHNSNIRISAEELRKLNRSSIQLQDGSGDYFGGLSAHHHLHCIKSVRRVLYRDYYGLPEEDWMWSHLDHCLEDLRQTVQCNADFSIITYDWLPNYRRPWANFKVDGECVNWEALDNWAGDRFFSLFDEKSLVHPELGISYPMVNGEPTMDSTPHPQVEDIQALRDGTNPKDVLYDPKKGESPGVWDNLWDNLRDQD